MVAPGKTERVAIGSLGVVSSILSQAFNDDPVLRWINSDPEFAPSFFRMILPAFIDKGLTFLEGQHRGAASWLGPEDHLTWPHTLGSLVGMARLCGFRGTYRLALIGSRTGRYHPREPHYYLFAIGAIPSCQGQGVGSALLSHILRRCDKEQMPAYLENSRQKNLDFYRGHGFEVQRKIQLADNAPPLWLMLREPRRPVG
jgi:ribosomal protein S18 acetylase RimI-like enzyme